MRAIMLEAPALDAAGHMALDEAVFGSLPADSLALRLYRWERPASTPAAATFGYFQRYEDAAGEVRSRGHAVTFPLVRRLTGGGVVFHDGDITFSIVFPWDRISAPDFMYKDLHRAVHLGLKARGLVSRLWSPPKKDAKPQLSCFSAPSPMDLVHEDGTKLLGGALRRRAGRGLYQGSMRPEGFGVPRRRLEEAVAEGISLNWKVLFSPQAPDGAALASAERLKKERYGADAWNKKR